MITTAVFDLGGVLIDWDPRHLYRKLFEDAAEMEAFLAEVCNGEWNGRQDEGRPFAEAVAELSARHPQQRDMIAAYHDRWPEMLGGAIDDTVAILAELQSLGRPLYALTNWSAETFPHARERFDFLAWFDGLVVSGEEGVKKPDPEIFEILLRRHGLDPAGTVFIDDSAGNVAAAGALGFEAVHFTSAAELRSRLRHLGLL